MEEQISPVDRAFIYVGTWRPRCRSEPTFLFATFVVCSRFKLCGIGYAMSLIGVFFCCLSFRLDADPFDWK